MRHVIYAATSIAFLGALAGCPDRTISEVKPQQQGAVTKKIPVSADIDILFVIDNSASTLDKQTAFAKNFLNFVQALDAFPSGRPNLHIGVVSSTVGTKSDQNFGPNCPKTATQDDGLLQNTARVSGCTPPTGRFISDIKNSGGTRTTNYAGTLDTTLSCIAQLGTSGCGFEAQLEAMKLALDGSRPENAGFLRQGAYLAVIILTDEDDCSVKDPALFSLGSNSGPGDFRCQPLYAYKCDTAINAAAGGNYTNCKPLTGSYLKDPSDYFGFLTTIKDPSQIVVATIAGGLQNGMPPDGAMVTTGMISTPFVQSLALLPSCTFTNAMGMISIGRPAIRIDAFRRLFGDHGLYGTVCQADYSTVIAAIGNLLFNAISPCLEGKINTAPAYPSGQPECTVSDVQVGQAESLIPPCTTQAVGANGPNGSKPCWWIKDTGAGGACGTTATHLELHIERAAPPSIGTTVEISCATAP